MLALVVWFLYPSPPAPPGPGEDPMWWPGRNRDLQDLREQFPAFGDQDRDRIAFQSDCAFDHFISPITNPFLAEDPRSLTELRPLGLVPRVNRLAGTIQSRSRSTASRSLSCSPSLARALPHFAAQRAAFSYLLPPP